MKKRKPPVVLASLIVVMLGAAVIIALPKADNHDHGQKMTAEDAIPDGAARPTPTKEQLKAALAGGGPQTPDEEMGPFSGNPLKNNPKQSTIFLPKATAFKPTPNDSAVSGQWYRGQARASDPKGFKTP